MWILFSVDHLLNTQFNVLDALDRNINFTIYFLEKYTQGAYKWRCLSKNEIESLKLRDDKFAILRFIVQILIHWISSSFINHLCTTFKWWGGIYGWDGGASSQSLEKWLQIWIEKRLRMVNKTRITKYAGAEVNCGWSISSLRL